MKDYLLCYDIADKKRLYKVRKLSYPYALGGQKSALFVPLSKYEVKELLGKLDEIIDPKEDRINLIEVDKNLKYLGKNPDILYEDGAIIIWDQLL